MTETTHAAPRAMSRGARSFGERLIAALKLETALYEEVEHDQSALGQAAVVVGLAALASAVGALGVLGPGAILAGLVAAFVSWLVWTALVWLVGVKMFGHTSDFEELLRTLGFVAAPQILNVLMLVPFAIVQSLVGIAVLAMTAIAFIRATREALDIDTPKAVGVAALGVVVYVVLAAAFGTGAYFG